MIPALLEQYLEGYRPSYTRSEQKQAVDTFIKGLLSDLDRKSIEPIALRYRGEKGVRPMQLFFKNAKLDDDTLLSLYQQQLASLFGEEDGMLNVDGSDFPKKGTHSVGVSRQYCGRLGKRENCQAGLFVGYASSKGYGLVDRQLYMPASWFSDPYAGRRQQCAVPEQLSFKTKNEWAAEMLQRVADAGRFPFRWIGCDAAFGGDRAFLAALPAGCYYFADIYPQQRVFRHQPDMQVPSAKTRGRRPKYPKPSIPPVSVAQIADDPELPWQRIVLAEGAKGPIWADVKCTRVVTCVNLDSNGNYPGPGESAWLYIRRYANGRIKHSLCNAPEETPMKVLNRVATLRWPIEQCFEEMKSHLGMGHGETRSYPAWHRHMLFVMMAHLFTQMLRIHFKKNGCVDDADGQATGDGSSESRSTPISGGSERNSLST